MKPVIVTDVRVVFLLFLTVSLFRVPAVHADDGQVWVSGWHSTASLTTARAGAAMVHVGKRIYLLGGVDGIDFLDSTEYTSVNDDGSLAPWRRATIMTEPRGFFDAVANNGYIYAVGGGNGPGGHHLLQSVERAEILADGSLGKWQTEKTKLTLPRRCVKLVLLGKDIYAFGGFGGTLLDSVEVAHIQPDGHLSAWRMLDERLTIPRYVHAAKLIGATVLNIGGHNQDQGVGQSEVEWAVAKPGQTLGGWKEGPPLRKGRFGHGAAVHGDFVYTIGGLDGINFLSSVEKSRLQSDGSPGPWHKSTPLSAPRANFDPVVIGDWIYIIGGTNSMGYFDSVEYSGFNDKGDIGFWGSKADARKNGHQEKKQVRARTAVTLANSGEVLETIPALQYSYIHVKTAGGDEWIAASQGDYKPGQQIQYSNGIMLSNFHSKTLNRTFASIRFVSRVEIVQ
jgi:hypothetical protein